MRKVNRINRKKLMPLRLIAQDSPYSAAYLSVLVQRKKLKVEKVGRNYFSTKEWFEEYMLKHGREEKRNNEICNLKLEIGEIEKKISRTEIGIGEKKRVVHKKSHFTLDLRDKIEPAALDSSGLNRGNEKNLDSRFRGNDMDRVFLQPQKYIKQKDLLKNSQKDLLKKSAAPVKKPLARKMSKPASPKRIEQTVFEPIMAKKLFPAWVSRIIDMFIVFLAAVMVFYPAQLDAAMQSDNYVIYDSVMYSFDGPVISGVACAAIDEGMTVTWNTDVIADGFVVYDTDSGMLSTHEQGLSAKTGTSHSVSVSGLEPATTYYYRVRSTRVNDGVTVDSTVRSCVSGGTAVAEPSPTVETVRSGGGGVLIIDKTDQTAPIISGLAVSEITSNSALITWQTDEDSTSFVEIGETEAYGRTQGVWNSVKAHSVRLENLQADTAYHIRALSSDGWGNPGRSEDRLFMTPPAGQEAEPESEEQTEEKEEPTPPDIKLSVERVVGFMNQISRGVPITELQRQLLLEYEALKGISQAVPSPIFAGNPVVEAGTDRASIRWQTDRDANSIVAIASDKDYRPRAAEPYAMTVGDPETYVRDHNVQIFGLIPDTVYHFQVRSKASVGPYGRTGDLTFRTKTESLEISNYYAQVVDVKTAQFRWVTNGDADSAVRITPYRGNVLSIDETKVIKDNAMTAVHVMTIAEFQEGVKYEIELFSQDAAGRSATANIPLFSTSEEDHAPEISRIQTNSTVFQDKSNKIQTIISWQTNEPATSQIYYREGVMDIATDTADKTDFVEDYSRDHVIVVTKFKAGTVYSFRVESIDSGGNDVLSEVHTFMTPKKRESILDMIIRILEDMFGWVRNIY